MAWSLWGVTSMCPQVGTQACDQLGRGTGWDALLAACWSGCTQERMLLCKKRDALLKRCMGEHSDLEEGRAMFRVRNSFTWKRGCCMWTPCLKVKLKDCWPLLSSLHTSEQLLMVCTETPGTRHQGQQRMLVLAQECFWWPKMEGDCWALVQGCQTLLGFEGAIVKAPLCSIQAYVPLELVHVEFTSIETTMELNQLPSIKNGLVLLTTSQGMWWHSSLRTRKLRLLCVSSMSILFQYSAHQQSCLVTVVQTSCQH